jgi:hypothetical protein
MVASGWGERVLLLKRVDHIGEQLRVATAPIGCFTVFTEL